MKITVSPKGIVKKYVQAQDLEVEAGHTPALLLERLNLPLKMKLTVFVNGRKAGPDQVLTDGDEVRLVALLGGG